MRSKHKLVRVDPYMQDKPQIVYMDATGKVLGEVYVLPLWQVNEGLINQKKRAR